MDAILGTHRHKLAEGTVRPGGVVMLKVFGQHLAQMVLIDDQHPVEKLPPQAPRAKPRAAYWSAPKLPDSPSIRMDVWKGEVIASTEEELLAGIQG